MTATGLHAEQLFASTTPGLEPVLADELRALGMSPALEPGGVGFEGPRGTHRRANLWLRTASRVLLRVATLPVADLGAWSRLSLSAYWDGRAPVFLSASGPAASKLEATARQAWRLPTSRGPADDERGEDDGGCHLLLRSDGKHCTVSVDTSGALLHFRGYRQEVGRAPMRETLAAGMLRLAGYDGREPLVDGMCGSGTLSIEAALIALGRAPGLLRAFAFERWPAHDAAAWQRERAEAQAAPAPQHRPLIFASDLNAGALGTARRNAKRAGVFEVLRLERKDAAALTASAEAPNGLFVANLPYGKRVGEKSELGALFAAVGKTLRTGLAGYRWALLAADEPGLDGALGLDSPRQVKLSNGGIPCRLLLGGPVRR